MKSCTKEMKKKDRLKRDLKQSLINQGVLNHWWNLVQAVEAIRADVGNKVAVFRLGTALQSLICMSLEYGDRRVLMAVPEDQRDLLDTILVDGLELATTALAEGTQLFEGMQFPSPDEVFGLLSGLMFHR
ncbi:MAG: hypothetical protein AB1733_11340 [Thermodesulfobacteriota bacterium]